MEPLATSTGSLFSWNGVILILMILNVTLERSSLIMWAIRTLIPQANLKFDDRYPIPQVSTHPLLVWWSAWTWSTTYGRPTEIGSQVWNLWSSKPWPRSWKPILLVMYFGNAFARDCNYTHLNRLLVMYFGNAFTRDCNYTHLPVNRLNLIWTAKYNNFRYLTKSLLTNCSQNYSELFSNQIICQYFSLSAVSPSSLIILTVWQGLLTTLMYIV